MKTMPNIEPNKEQKQDVKMMKTEPDTYEEEKIALILGTTACLHTIVDVQMSYHLLVFVMKYVYTKTPTPVMRAHKF